MKKKANMKPGKENNKALIIDPKEMELYELSKKEFRIILLKRFSELQEHRNNK